MSHPSRCDVPQVGAWYVLPEGAVLPNGLDAGMVLSLPLSAYIATVQARTHEQGTEPPAALSTPIQRALQRASKGLHQVDIRAMRQRVYELQAEGQTDDQIVIAINRGEVAGELDGEGAVSTSGGE